jgi:hypothetical protein
MTPSILLDHTHEAAVKLDSFKKDAPDILEIPPEDLPLKYGWPTQNARGYKIHEENCGTMRPFRVIHVGAGASGICFAKFAEEMLTNVTIQIYDKNPDVVCSSPRLQCKESTR